MVRLRLTACLSTLVLGGCASMGGVVPPEFSGLWTISPSECGAPTDTSAFSIEDGFFESMGSRQRILKTVLSSNGELEVTTAPDNGFALLSLSPDRSRLRVDEGGESEFYYRCTVGGPDRVQDVGGGLTVPSSAQR